ncbi:PAS domain S-box protein [Novosphingobium olei]|uniref:histidine kinase n=1 Tax=Novosphingobium olei TaxID=2728851 RepID=A0A7Y0BM35_9SPHN|nr:PAS domain S-box protein [Novosphingobium olei]NML92865.1 PAS domain S-box protein [Novosphingobium olei]
MCELDSEQHRQRKDARLHTDERVWSEHGDVENMHSDFHRLAFEKANVGMAQVSIDGRFLQVNPFLEGLLGRSQQELLALSFQDITHPDDLDADLGYVQDLLNGALDVYTMEKRYIRADGTTVWTELSVSLLRDASGAPLNFISVISDIHKRKEAQEQVQLLLDESGHRVRNLIAVVGAIVSGSAKVASSAAELERSISQRLAGIAASHDLLLGKATAGGPLDKLIERQLEIFAHGSADRVLIEGEHLELLPSAVHAFGMTLHELATNAVKYGALGDQGGIVRIRWRIDRDASVLHFSWREEGGPPVVQTGRRGFGTKSLGRMLGSALGGRVRFDLLADGALLEAELPLYRVASP